MEDDTQQQGVTYGTQETESRGYTPEAYKPVIDRIAPGLSEVANAIKVPGEDQISAWARALGQLSMADYQRRLLNVQLERARAGLRPLNASEYGIGVNVAAPQLNLLLLAGLGLAAVFLLRRR